MSIDACFNTVDRLKDEYLALLIDLCNIESNSYDKEGVDRVLAYLLKHANTHGYESVVEEFDHAGNVAALTYNQDDSLPLICLSAHMDTVHPKGLFGYPPVKEDAQYLYGPGVSDCKGGIALALLCMASLQEIGFKKASIRLILQSDEEVSSVLTDKKSLAFMCRQAAGAKAFFNLESSEKNHVTTQRYGILQLRFHVHGKASHACMKETGINAITEAAHKILSIEAIPTSDHLSYNVGTIEGGTAPNGVPAHCSFTVDVRVKTKNDIALARKELQEIADTIHVPGTHCTLETISERIPMEYSEKNAALFECFAKAVKQAFGEELVAVTCKGGADSAYTTAAGIPTIDSVSLAGFREHSADEKADKASFVYAAKRLIAGIYALCDCEDE